MAERRAIDYSFARPNPADIKAGGYEAVLRYLSPGNSSKNLTAAEAKALHAAGLSIGLVWESTANRAVGGATAGAADVQAAEAAADALGYPKDAVIFYAVDFDANPTEVQGYFTGVRAHAKRHVGIYGGIRVADAQLAPYVWQTAAWSGGKLSPAAHIYQRIRAIGSIPHTPHSDYDEDVLIKDVPLWDAPTAPKPAPRPVAPQPQTRVSIVRAKYAQEGLIDLHMLQGAAWRPRVRIVVRALQAAMRLLPKS